MLRWIAHGRIRVTYLMGYGFNTKHFYGTQRIEYYETKNEIR